MVKKLLNFDVDKETCYNTERNEREEEIFMGVKIDGITRLRANYYNKLVIREDIDNRNYRVNVSGNKINYETETVGKSC